MKEESWYVGAPVKRKEEPGLIGGPSPYVDGITPAKVLYMSLAPSPDYRKPPDALAPFGVEIRQGPLSPEKVWSYLSEAKKAEIITTRMARKKDQSTV